MNKFIDECSAPHILKYFEMWRSAVKHLQDTFGEDYVKLIGNVILEVGINGDTPHDWEKVGVVMFEDEDYPVLKLD